METYSKIETLFDRKEDFTVDTSRVRRPAFDIISHWIATEKIDGTNIRIGFSRTPGMEIAIGGRTDKAQIPSQLFIHLQNITRIIQPEVRRIMTEHSLNELVLYGEGYGAGIQNGGAYRQDQGFILFDIGIGNGKYLDDEAVTETAERLGLTRAYVYNDGEPMSTWEIIQLVKAGPHSMHARETLKAEGVVARPVEPLWDRRGQRIMWKLKRKDFVSKANDRKQGNTGGYADVVLVPAAPHEQESQA